MLFLYHGVTFAGVSTSVTGIEFVDPYLRVAFAQLK